MKTKILMLVVLMGLSAVVMAQRNENRSGKQLRGQDREMRMGDNQRGPANGLNLTDEQKEAFKESRLATQKLLQPLQNELGEVKARQKTLMSAQEPDMSAINANIEKMGTLKIEMAKIQAKQRLEMRAKLTDEQRLKFDNHQGRKIHNKRSMGMRQDQEMQDSSSMN